MDTEKLYVSFETRYYKDKEKTILHREDGPAIEYLNGDKAWYRDGKLHREDGPAVEYVDGGKEYWYGGEYYSDVKNDDSFLQRFGREGQGLNIATENASREKK